MKEDSVLQIIRSFFIIPEHLNIGDKKKNFVEEILQSLHNTHQHNCIKHIKSSTFDLIYLKDLNSIISVMHSDMDLLFLQAQWALL